MEHVLGFPAAQLLIERAAAVRPGFRLRDRDDAVAVARLCQRLDGIPLALELAAARTTVLSVGQIAARLDDRFQLLTGGSRAVMPRHQTLRALIDWSYDSLPEAEAALLRRLSVFAGGWTLEAAEAVAGDTGRESGLPSPVLDLLDALEERSLVLAEAGAAGLRYRMLETVREYSLQKLQAGGEECAVRSAHGRLTSWGWPKLPLRGMHGPEQSRWLNLLEAEHGNLRAALAGCLETPGGGEVGRRLAAALAPFWELRGDLSEGREALSAALALPGAPADRTRARILVGAGRLARLQGNWSAAQTFWTEALGIWRQLGDTERGRRDAGGAGRSGERGVPARRRRPRCCKRAWLSGETWATAKARLAHCV